MLIMELTKKCPEVATTTSGAIQNNIYSDSKHNTITNQAHSDTAPFIAINPIKNGILHGGTYE
jgi:hypothetical protein